MPKVSGFTIIEILTTITILGIIATISVPEYWRWRDRDQFRAQGQAFFDTLLDARNAALTNKLCSNGNTSFKWRIVFDADANPPRYELYCHWDDTNASVVEQSNVLMDKTEVNTVDFNETNPPAAMSGGSIPDNVEIAFFSGSASGRLDYDDGSLNRADQAKIVLGHTSSDFVHAICFNRVAGFPSFNKVGSDCLEY